MPSTEQQFRDEIVRIGRLMYEKDWIAATDGNITARLPEGQILATPAGVCKGMLEPQDLILCDLDGKKIAGRPSPHLRDGHAPHHLSACARMPWLWFTPIPPSTGFAVAGRELNLGLLPEVIVALGRCPWPSTERPERPP